MARLAGVSCNPRRISGKADGVAPCSANLQATISLIDSGKRFALRVHSLPRLARISKRFALALFVSALSPLLAAQNLMPSLQGQAVGGTATGAVAGMGAGGVGANTFSGSNGGAVVAPLGSPGAPPIDCGPGGFNPQTQSCWSGPAVKGPGVRGPNANDLRWETREPGRQIEVFGRQNDVSGRQGDEFGGQNDFLGRQSEEMGRRRGSPTQALTDFQLFVARATGRILPIFGSNLFDAPGSFGATGNAPVPAEYVVGPGDELILTMTGVLETELKLTVDRNGQVVLPKVGPVTVVGQRVGALTSFLSQQLSRVYRNFNLAVSLGRLRTIDVYVVGAARQPGRYSVSSAATMINLLFTSGGPSSQGSMRRIDLVRGNKVVTTLDIYEFFARGDTQRDRRLLPGDVLLFHPVGPQVALTGAVKSAGIYELPPESNSSEPFTGQSAGGGRTLGAVLAGQLSVLAEPKRARIERIVAADALPRRVEELALDTFGLATPLRDGDLVTVLEIQPAFANAVTLRGAVAQAMRYPFRPGMRIRDLIPGPEALISREFHLNRNGEIVRSERDLGLVSRNADEVNWDYAVIERFDRKELVSLTIPFHLGRAVLQGDPEHNRPLEAGDTVTVFSKNDLRVRLESQSRTVRVEGEVMQPGLYPLKTGQTLGAILAGAGGLTPQAYLFGLELQREGVRKMQRENLARLIQEMEREVSVAETEAAARASVDPTLAASQRSATESTLRAARARITRLSALEPNGRIALGLNPENPVLPDLPLEGGDRIYVASKPGVIAVSGAVRNESVLQWVQGRTVAEYLELAGVTDAADEDAIFVLRADGTVSARPRKRAWWQDWINSEAVPRLKLMPGDAIIVPERIARESEYVSFMRGLKDWSQVIAQLGLGAAAIRTLK